MIWGVSRKNKKIKDTFTNQFFIFIERIEKDQSYMVVSAALRSLGKTNPNKALELAKKLVAE